jgi:hypothetical protein
MVLEYVCVMVLVKDCVSVYVEALASVSELVVELVVENNSLEYYLRIIA